MSLSSSNYLKLYSTMAMLVLKSSRTLPTRYIENCCVPIFHDYVSWLCLSPRVGSSWLAGRGARKWNCVRTRTAPKRIKLDALTTDNSIFGHFVCRDDRGAERLLLFVAIQFVQLLHTHNISTTIWQFDLRLHEKSVRDTHKKRFRIVFMPKCSNWCCCCFSCCLPASNSCISSP